VQCEAASDNGALLETSQNPVFAPDQSLLYLYSEGIC
jgi:hypothetical protein